MVPRSISGWRTADVLDDPADALRCLLVVDGADHSARALGAPSQLLDQSVPAQQDAIERDAHVGRCDAFEELLQN